MSGPRWACWRTSRLRRVFDPVDRVLLPCRHRHRDPRRGPAGTAAGRSTTSLPTAPCAARRPRRPANDQDRWVRRGLLHVGVRRCATSSGSQANRTRGPSSRASAQTAETAVEFDLRRCVRPETASVPDLVGALAAHAARLRAEGALPRRARSRAARGPWVDQLTVRSRNRRFANTIAHDPDSTA